MKLASRSVHRLDDSSTASLTEIGSGVVACHASLGGSADVYSPMRRE